MKPAAGLVRVSYGPGSLIGSPGFLTCANSQLARLATLKSLNNDVADTLHLFNDVFENIGVLDTGQQPQRYP